jgi:uncharacterized protein YjbI with pentapeptide repeats
MAHAAHLEVLTKAPEKWNEFRSKMKIEVPDLSNANLSNLNLTDCDLSFGLFSRSILDKVKLKRTNFQKAIFDYGVIKYSELDQTNFREANFQFAKLSENTSKGPSDFSGTVFSRSSFFNCDLSFCCFFRSVIESCSLDLVNLNVCDCRYSSFKDSSIRNSSLVLTNCLASDFEIRDIEKTDLSRINLTGASTLLNLDLHAHGFVGSTLKKIIDEPDQLTLPLL